MHDCFTALNVTDIKKNTSQKTLSGLQEILGEHPTSTEITCPNL